MSLVTVVAIGLALAASYRSEAARRGLAEGSSEARLIARASIEPIIAGRNLGPGIDAGTRAALTRTTNLLVDHHAVLRLRLRNTSGVVVFSNDGSGLGEAIEDEVLEAAEGHTQVSLTRLNSDSNDAGPALERAVEVYLPVHDGVNGPTSGVLELYLPYAPIDDDIAAGLHVIYRDLVLGLAALYAVLLALSVATTRRLRHHSRRNAYLAEHDQLTGLPNRRVFDRSISRAIVAIGGPASVAVADTVVGGVGAVAVVDLDRFKDVNDSLGHHNGDRLLTRVSERLVGALPTDAIVARLGADEFGVILQGQPSVAAVQDLLTRLKTRISEPAELGNLSLVMDASVGFAVIGQDGTDAEGLLQRAQTATYSAKTGNREVTRFHPALDRFDAERLAVVGDLRKALAGDELVLHYQPKLRLADDAVVSVEALIRWQHPRRGLLYPDAFLTVAEQTDLIDPLTDWVVASALRQLRLWGDESDLSMSVNVSARNLGHPGFARRVKHLVDVSAVPPERLVVEVTETALFADVDRAAAVLSELSTSGIRISLDDFGQGQTSLSYLSRLPLDELKIDKAFVTGLVHDHHNRAIVRSLVDLAHRLGFVVVAEGVEDAATMDALRAMGCDEIQGYLLSRPCSPDDFAAWLATRGAPARHVRPRR